MMIPETATDGVDDWSEISGEKTEWEWAGAGKSHILAKPIDSPLSLDYCKYGNFIFVCATVPSVWVRSVPDN